MWMHLWHMWMWYSDKFRIHVEFNVSLSATDQGLRHTTIMTVQTRHSRFYWVALKMFLNWIWVLWLKLVKEDLRLISFENKMILIENVSVIK